MQLAENHFQVKLPIEYIELLKQQNGGSLIYNALPIAFNRYEDDDHLEIDHFLGIKKDKGILETDYYVQEWGINRQKIILISGDGHSWFALDYNNKEVPSVIYIETDEDKITDIYPTFQAMLDHLYLHEWDDDGEFSSIEEGRRLIQSKDIEDIYQGISIFCSYFFDNSIQEEFYGYLKKLFKSENDDVKHEAVGALWRTVEMYEGNVEHIKLLINDLKNDKSPIIQDFLQDIMLMYEISRHQE
ncbi:hypothetical protein CEQ21_21135 [Niallia circulans]|uniref:Knr4/Smi1-like domain-containing protein n=1 Tax=Niallia circulans TaxID=1397 RepID=A0A553SLR3_NIACI|nr:SMI1/KNR4 family protein [Niallia circulans]TRZ37930.1 hypothetical protein CEQ21_21135 [Niallia circulans]